MRVAWAAFWDGNWCWYCWVYVGMVFRSSCIFLNEEVLRAANLAQSFPSDMNPLGSTCGCVLVETETS